MRILFLEDDMLIGDAIQKALVRDGYTVDWLTDGADLDDFTLVNDVDLLILDLSLPGRDGMDLLKELRLVNRSLPVLVVTARYELDARVQGLDLGADDYMVKPVEMAELLARCRALARRRDRGEPQALYYRGLSVDPASCTVTRDGDVVSFTPKVFRLLQLFIENQGRVLTRSVLEEHLYGWEHETESNTLEVFVSRIRRKLGADFIQTIRGVGYFLPKE